MTSTVYVDCHGTTNTGRERDANEDQFLIADLSKSLLVTHSSLPIDDHTRLWSPVQGKLLVVADGMGGMTSGARASSVAVRVVTHYALHFMPWFFRLDEQRESDLNEELRAALTRADQAVTTDAGAARRGMGTTLTMAYVLWPGLYVVHAGDSRCYVLRAGRLHQVTRDHTLAQQMVEDGSMDREEAEQSDFAHIVVNALVAHDSVTLVPEVHSVELAYGDQLLLCSDGLSGPVPKRDLRAALEQAPTAEAACEQLIRLANEAGGPDNITVVVARFVEPRDGTAAGDPS